MSKQFIISELAPTRVDQAFPLVQAAHRTLTPQCWRDVAARFLTEQFGMDASAELAEQSIGGQGIAGGLDLDRPPASGIYGCATETGSLRGLLCYRAGRADHGVGQGPDQGRGPSGRCLNIPILVAVGLFDTVATVEALREAAERLALRLRCGSLSIELGGCRLSSLAPAIEAVDHFTAQGYCLEGRKLIRLLTSDQTFPHFARA